MAQHGTDTMKHSVTILNGDKHMAKQHSRGRSPRRNPDGELAREIGKSLVTTALGAAAALAVAYGASKLPIGAPVAGATPVQAAARVKNTVLAKNAAIAAASLALGGALHMNGVAPRVGKAVMAGGTTLAAASVAMVYNVPARIDALYQPAAPAAPALPPPTSQGMYDGWQSWNRAVEGVGG